MFTLSISVQPDGNVTEDTKTLDEGKVKESQKDEKKTAVVIKAFLLNDIFHFMIHSADPRSRLVVIIVFTQFSTCPSVFHENSDHYWGTCGSGQVDH